MGRLTARRKVIRVDLATGSTSRSETAAVEEPLELRVDDAVLTVTMRTPGHDVELAHGLLRSEGVISDPDDVIAARYCTDTETLNVLQVQLRTTARRCRCPPSAVWRRTAGAVFAANQASTP